MPPEALHRTDFIRGHCGSVATEAPPDRATGAQWQRFLQLPSVHLQGNGTGFHSNHPAREAFPPGMRWLRVFHP